jgi:hypothetical protein
MKALEKQEVKDRATEKRNDSVKDEAVNNELIAELIPHFYTLHLDRLLLLRVAIDVNLIKK